MNEEIKVIIDGASNLIELKLSEGSILRYVGKPTQYEESKIAKQAQVGFLFEDSNEEVNGFYITYPFKLKPDEQQIVWDTLSSKYENLIAE